MTATQPHARPAPATSPAPGRQWMALTRHLSVSMLQNLAFTTLALLAAGGLVWLLTQGRGGEWVADTTLDGLGAEVSAGRDGVRVVWSVLLLPVGVAFAAVALLLAHAGSLRVLVASGATRRAVWTALLVTGVIVAAFVMALGVLTLVVAGGWPGAAELAAGALRLGGLLAVVMALGLAIVALFLRWSWWVGTCVLVVLSVAPAVVVGAAPLDVLDSVTAGLPWPGTELVAAAVLGAVSWVVARRIPVR